VAARRLDHGSTISEEESTRVLLVDLDTMPRQLIRHDLEHEHGIALVEAPPGAPLAEAVASVDPHVVLIGRDDPDAAAEVLGERPLVRLLAVVRDSRHLLLYELRPRRRRIGVFSTEQLLRALRRARTPRSSWMP
jgi:hypothetical protein